MTFSGYEFNSEAKSMPLLVTPLLPNRCSALIISLPEPTAGIPGKVAVSQNFFPQTASSSHIPGNIIAMHPIPLAGCILIPRHSSMSLAMLSSSYLLRHSISFSHE